MGCQGFDSVVKTPEPFLVKDQNSILSKVTLTIVAQGGK